MYGRRRGPHQRHALLLLLLQVYQIGVDNIPPVTLFTLVLCVALHLGTTTNQDFLPSFSSLPAQSVLSPVLSLFGSLLAAKAVTYNFSTMGGVYGYQRGVLCQLFHADDWHLYYNMCSWMYKGRTMELIVGTDAMIIFVLLATLCTPLCYILLCYLATSFGFASTLGVNANVIGFSGVLFCIKVIVNWNNYGEEQVFYFRTPARHAVWAELLLVHIFTPHVSLVGHLAGILCGYVFMKVEMDKSIRLVWGPWLHQRRIQFFQQN